MRDLGEQVLPFLGVGYDFWQGLSDPPVGEANSVCLGKSPGERGKCQHTSGAEELSFGSVGGTLVSMHCGAEFFQALAPALLPKRLRRSTYHFSPHNDLKAPPWSRP